MVKFHFAAVIGNVALGFWYAYVHLDVGGVDKISEEQDFEYAIPKTCT
jgi:hypothetical protein